MPMLKIRLLPAVGDSSHMDTCSLCFPSNQNSAPWLQGQFSLRIAVVDMPFVWTVNMTRYSSVATSQ